MTPPEFSHKFLRWFCREEYLEEIEGNLEEIFEKEFAISPERARRNYRKNVLRHFRPSFIKRFRFPITNNISDMLRHHLLITFRNFMKYKSTFFINVTGLSTGLATVFLVFLWVNDEWNVNKFNRNDERLYQVFQNSTDNNGATRTGSGTAGILAETLAAEMPEVEHAVSIVPPSWFNVASVIGYEGKKVKTTNQFIGKDFFQVFDVNVIRGDKKTSMKEKYSIMISEQLATNLFGDIDDAIGKAVEFRWELNQHLYQITGVFRLPSNVTEKYEVLVNYDIFLDSKDWLKEWGNSDPNTFVVLKSGADVSALSAKLNGFLQTKDKNITDRHLVMQKYSDTYLYNRFEDGKPAGGRIEYVRLFSLIAVVILVIACINFMNLSTARATRRLKEVGVKKAIGAKRGSLTAQFLSESMALSFISAVVAFMLAWLLIPGFNQLTGKNIVLTFDPIIFGIALLVIVFTGFVSGSYPALYLSKFKAGDVLKGKLRSSFGELLARKGLVVFQYVISFVLIVGVIIIYQQINFVQSTNLGYDREHIVHFDLEIETSSDPNFYAPGGAWEKGLETFMSEISKVPGVTGVANYWHDVTGDHGGLGGVDWEAGDKDEAMEFSNLEVGYDFLPVLGVPIASGRNYSREFSNEASKIILNETAVKLMGLKDPVGHHIKLWGQDREIIGVAKDFHYESLYEQVKPCVIQLVSGVPKVMVKIEGTSMAEALPAIGKLYETKNPGLGFEHKFLDDDYDALYTAEQRVSVLSQLFACLAIVISCLGLYGLTAFTVERRMKEISIRKVFGASQGSIVRLLSSEFTTLVMIAIAVGLPIVWIGGRAWLDSFAYQTDLSYWYFISGVIAIFAITFITISMNTMKAGKANPAETLRSE